MPWARGAGERLHAGTPGLAFPPPLIFFFPELPRRRVPGRAGARLEAAVIGADVLRILVAQTRDHPRHDRVLARTGFEVLKLLGEVIAVLSGELRYREVGAAVAIGAVTTGADRGPDLPGSRVASGMRRRYKDEYPET